MAVTAPDRLEPGWAAREGLAALAEAVAPARAVGGAVRDAVLGVEAADLDLATPHPPDEVMRRLKLAGIRAVPTGLAHGTVTAVLASGPVEVTSLRRDVETDGRHAVVAYTNSWEEDSGRRDFTVNALYADVGTGELWDYHGGLADLAARRVRFIGDPDRRIAEDRLRILRFFRFHARFGDAPDEGGLLACERAAGGLAQLSVERVAGEICKLLAAAGGPAAARLMLERRIWKPVLPEADADGVERLERVAAAEAAAGLPPSGVRRLAALVPHAAADEVGRRLKLSNADRRRLAGAGAGPGAEGPAALAYRVGAEGAADRLLLAGEPVAGAARLVSPKLPLTGGDLVARGMRPGPAVSRALRLAEDWWVAAGFPDAVPTDVLDRAVREAGGN